MVDRQGSAPRILKWSAFSGDTFVKPILDRLSQKFRVLPLEAPGRADLLWFDWCDGMLVETLKHSDRLPPVIARLHSYEVNTEHPANVDWSKVSALIFVADHIREKAISKFDIKVPIIRTIPNGVDLDTFEPYKRVGWVGHSPEKKGANLFVRVVKESPPWCHFMVAGFGVEDYLRGALDDYLARVEFCGWVDDMPWFWGECDYVLSCSPWEGTCQSLLEGIAAGCIPIVPAEEWARRQFPSANVLHTPSDIRAILGRYMEDVPEQRLCLDQIDLLVEDVCPSAS